MGVQTLHNAGNPIPVHVLKAATDNHDGAAWVFLRLAQDPRSIWRGRFVRLVRDGRVCMLHTILDCHADSPRVSVLTDEGVAGGMDEVLVLGLMPIGDVREPASPPRNLREHLATLTPALKATP